jgi:hypothetical protein
MNATPIRMPGLGLRPHRGILERSRQAVTSVRSWHLGFREQAAGGDGR